jgi:hypothetical protein
MVTWLWYVIGLVITFIVTLFFEAIRDFYMDILDSITDLIEDIFGDLGEGFVYVITFEWVGDIPDFFSSMFEDLGEFSIYGLTFGILSIGMMYATRYINLAGSGMGLIESMTQYMSPTQRIFWTIASYVGSFIAGYFIGKYFENTG